MWRILNLFFLLGSSIAAQSISITPMVEGSMSVRALAIDGSKIWYSANDGRYGFFDSATNTNYEKRIVFDSIRPEFRSLAQTSKAVFILGISSPALLYRIDKQTLKTKLAYRETHKKAFYDSMQFWDDTDGIAIGDPIDGKFSILVTHDGGNTWNKIDNAPESLPGEAAFAASNSNISIHGNGVWIATGGKTSRILFSPNRGKTWEVFETPMVSGGEMTGTFTSDFYNGEIGIIAGGDYEKPEQNVGNKAITTNGGRKWKLLSENSGFGYASCVRFFPDGKRVLCVGATGIWLSTDTGTSWQKVSDDTTFYTLVVSKSDVAYAAGKNKIVRISIEK